MRCQKRTRLSLSSPSRIAPSEWVPCRQALSESVRKRPPGQVAEAALILLLLVVSSVSALAYAVALVSRAEEVLVHPGSTSGSNLS